MKQIARIKAAFPSLPIEFYTILKDRIKENQFSNEKFIAAVNYVIDNCIYPTPTIANFLQFDEKVKFYTYNQFLKLVHENKNAGKQYKPCIVKFTKKPMWAHINDIEKFKLKKI